MEPTRASPARHRSDHPAAWDPFAPPPCHLYDGRLDRSPFRRH